jgi:DNA adenine methylase
MKKKANGGRLTPPLKWHGGKNYLADRIIDLMPRHLHYCEPYFGGGQVLFRRDPADRRLRWDGPTSDGRKADGVSEVVNDIDGDLMKFYAVLKDPGTFAALRHRLSLTLFSESEWQDAYRLLSGPDGSPVDRAAALFVQVRQSMAGRRTEFTPITRTRLRGGRNGEVNAWSNAIEGLAAAHERLRDVVVLCRQALEVIRQHDGPATLLYLDPPYLHETRAATEAYGRFEMTEADHRRLLDLLRVVKGKVVLSGYPSALYDRALAGWTRPVSGVPSAIPMMSPASVSAGWR